VHRGEGQLGLRLDAAGGEDLHVGCLITRILEQRSLADARVSPDDEDAALRVTGRIEEPGDEGALSVPPMEHASILGDAGSCG
jgi:hypothetical protein